MHTPVPVGSWHLQKLDARPACACRPTSIARRDAHRLSREAGLRALELEWLALPADRLPAPADGCSGSCDPPDLDYRCGGSAGFGRIRTGLPVLPSRRARSQPSAPPALERTPHAARSLPAAGAVPSRAARRGRPWHDPNQWELPTTAPPVRAARRSGPATWRWRRWCCVWRASGCCRRMRARELAQRIAVAWGAVLLAALARCIWGWHSPAGCHARRARVSSAVPAVLAARRGGVGRSARPRPAGRRPRRLVAVRAPRAARAAATGLPGAAPSAHACHLHAAYAYHVCCGCRRRS